MSIDGPTGAGSSDANMRPGSTLGTALDDPDDALAVAADDAQAQRRRRSRLLGYVATPLALGAASVALYLWVQSRGLDSIEARRVNAEVIRKSLGEHLQLSAVSTLFVLILAVPLGVVLTRPYARWITPAIVGVANLGQSVPSIGVIVLLALIWDIGYWPAIVALVAYSFLPVLRNTMVGLRQVDLTIIDAARGMGMTKLAVLGKVELPLSVPIILAGVRTALVINVGTATLAVFTAAGGLGVIVTAGISTSRETTIVTGAVLTAIVALGVDWLAGLAENFLRPKGL